MWDRSWHYGSSLYCQTLLNTLVVLPHQPHFTMAMDSEKGIAHVVITLHVMVNKVP